MTRLGMTVLGTTVMTVIVRLPVLLQRALELNLQPSVIGSYLSCYGTRFMTIVLGMTMLGMTVLGTTVMTVIVRLPVLLQRALELNYNRQ